MSTSVNHDMQEKEIAKTSSDDLGELLTGPDAWEIS